MLSTREAAEYCGLSPRRFSLECTVAPVEMPGGAKLYDMRDLDGWIDGLKDGAANDDETIVRRLNA
jgi:hypothetical protein